MYKVTKNNRPVIKQTFPSYEEARKALRRKVTKLFGYHDSFSQFGYSIQRV